MLSALRIPQQQEEEELDHPRSIINGAPSTSAAATTTATTPTLPRVIALASAKALLITALIKKLLRYAGMRLKAVLRFDPLGGRGRGGGGGGAVGGDGQGAGRAAATGRHTTGHPSAFGQQHTSAPTKSSFPTHGGGGGGGGGGDGGGGPAPLLWVEDPKYAPLTPPDARGLLAACRKRQQCLPLLRDLHILSAKTAQPQGAARDSPFAVPLSALAGGSGGGGGGGGQEEGGGNDGGHGGSNISPRAEELMLLLVSPEVDRMGLVCLCPYYILNDRCSRFSLGVHLQCKTFF